MEKARLILCAVAVCLFASVLRAQDKLNIEFGKVAAADFDLSGQKFDSGASAVIIADIGKTSFEPNRKSDLSMVFTRFMRVKVLNKNGFGIADNRIVLYHNASGDEEKITELKASTFNLDNGRVVETKLDPKSVFVEHYDRRHNIQKFVLPDLREGSVYDISYTVKSDFYANLRDWTFQGQYPRLWSEYEVTIPPVFHYVNRIQGDDHFDIATAKNVYQHYSIVINNGTQADDFFDFSGDSRQVRWVKKNVPGLREEPYTTTLDNYITRVSFKLNYIQLTSTSEKIVFLDSWFKKAEKMLDDEDFGKKLDFDNGWMAADIRTVTDGCKSEEEKIRKIFCFVRDNFSCSSHDGIYAQSSLKEVYKKKSGSTAEINLLLTAMLRQAKIFADPVVLSTRDHGVANQTYPSMEDFNYVICTAYAGEHQYSLDASQPLCGFGHLVEDCYNGDARIINREKPYVINLSSDSITEQKVTRVFIANDEKGILAGHLETTFGVDDSYALRDRLKKSSPAEYFKKVQTSYGDEVAVEGAGFDSLSRVDDPLSLHYDFNLTNLVSGNIVYFNPMMADVQKTNPLVATERHYPVEMPCRKDEMYVLSMDIPKGYSVDEMPKSAKVLLNETDGFFEYLIQKSESGIQMRVRLKLNKANFPTEDYASLRDFFAYIVKKENEQIVFKKLP